jgi:hypothetical protein
MLTDTLTSILGPHSTDCPGLKLVPEVFELLYDLAHCPVQLVGDRTLLVRR